MKRIDHIEAFPRTLIYDEGVDVLEKTVQVTGIKSGDILLMNTAEGVCTHFGKDQIVQTFICETDGISGCEIGNWISLRKHGSYYFFIPAFKLFEADYYKRRADEVACAPPDYITENGVIYFDKLMFSKLKEYVPTFRGLNHITVLTIEELIKIYRFETYLQIFDKPYPTPKPSQNIKLRTSLSDINIYIEKINNEFNLLHNSIGFKLKRITKKDHEVNIPIVSKTKKTIKAAVISGQGLHLRVGDFKIVLQSKSQKKIKSLPTDSG